jgi:hypothetical protein
MKVLPRSEKFKDSQAEPIVELRIGFFWYKSEQV